MMTMISVTNDKMQIYFPSMVYSGMGAGQGVAQAFEDAVHLAHAIQEGGLTPQSLRAFEAKRVSRLQEIMAAEMVSPYTNALLI